MDDDGLDQRLVGDELRYTRLTKFWRKSGMAQRRKPKSGGLRGEEMLLVDMLGTSTSVLRLMKDAEQRTHISSLS